MFAVVTTNSKSSGLPEVSINTGQLTNMKKQILYCIAVLILFLSLGTMPASAHSLEHLVTISIPFDFQVNDELLPAGKYVIKRDPQMPQILVIQCAARKISVMVHTIALNLSKEPARTSLTFKEYGGKHFLSEVKVLERAAGYLLTRSKTEDRLAKRGEAKTIRTISKGLPTKN